MRVSHAQSGIYLSVYHRSATGEPRAATLLRCFSAARRSAILQMPFNLTCFSAFSARMDGDKAHPNRRLANREESNSAQGVHPRKL
jgi:hypothetical protein